MNSKNIDLIAYPFLSEESSLVNHEILTDMLSSSLGRIIALKTPLEKETWWLMDKILHLNASIRGKMAITQRDLEEGLELYNLLKEKNSSRIMGFVYPVGHIIACEYHRARCEAKIVTRNLYFLRNQGIEIPEICIDFANLTANLLFVFSVEVNRINDIDEIGFISKSY
jgi:cob(I)alamin adenosyltransferase